MASPNKENGYVQVPNELLEAILKSNFSVRELKIIWEVIRFTDGFNREKAELSLRFISKGTGIDYSNLARSVTSLFKKNVLINCRVNELSGGRSIKLNKNYEQWKVKLDYKGATFGINGSGQNDNTGNNNSGQNDNGTVVKTTTETVVKTTTKKDKDKDNINTYALRNQSFINEVQNYKNQYTKDMLDDFVDYWTEANQLKTKMKFELEKTFDIGLRLKKWARNAAQWERNKSSGYNSKSNSNTYVESRLIKYDYDYSVLREAEY